MTNYTNNYIKPVWRRAVVHAELIGSETACAEGITAHNQAPVLALCRLLVSAGHDPDRPLEVYRGYMLALRVHTIGEGARLTVRDDNRGTPRFAAYRPGPDKRPRLACGGSSPVAQTLVAAE